MKNQITPPAKLHGLSGLLAFLKYLQSRKIWYTLAHLRDDSIMVTFTLVGYRVEVDFFEDDVEYSVFAGHEDVLTDEKELFSLIDRAWGDD